MGLVSLCNDGRNFLWKTQEGQTQEKEEENRHREMADLNFMIGVRTSILTADQKRDRHFLGFPPR